MGGTQQYQALPHPHYLLKLTKGTFLFWDFPPPFMIETQSASTLAKQEKSHHFHSPTMDSFFYVPDSISYVIFSELRPFRPFFNNRGWI